MGKKIFYWAAVIFYCSIIFYMSSLPGSNIPGPEGVDLSFLHVFEYAILAHLLYFSIKEDVKDNRKAVIYSIALSFIFGITDEIHQIYVPGRSFDYIDMFFNLIGSALIVYKIRSRR